MWVVRDIRDDNGFYYGFVKDTIDIFNKQGLKLYNDIILINRMGSAFLRAGAAFKYRKVIGLHQYVLVFYKGNPKLIPKNYMDKHKKKGNNVKYTSISDVI